MSASDLGELRIVRLLLRVEAQVLEQQQVARPQLLDGGATPAPSASPVMRTGPAQQLAEPIGDRLQAQRVVDLALGPAEVAGQHHAGAVLEQVHDGRAGWRGCACRR